MTKSKTMQQKVIKIDEYKKFKWFYNQLDWVVWWYDDVTNKFLPVFDDTRFADGMNFVCKKCGYLAGYVRMDGADLHMAYIVVHIVCNHCGNVWKRKGIMPMWERILMDWKEDS